MGKESKRLAKGQLLLDCSKCRTPLALPPGAKSIRCAVCHAVTGVATALPPPVGHTSAPPQANRPHQQGQSWPPNPQQYSPVPPNPHGKKRAVICGIAYKYTRHELKGSINDAKCMKYLLSTKFQFPESSILMLTDEEGALLKMPTKQNLRMAMHWLIHGCQPGDSLVFYYSGHGSQQRNRNKEEVDGYDETLCPLDFETQGMIVDDEINMSLVRPLTPSVRLHAVIDACHSGTVLDLPYVCKINRYGQFVWEDQRPQTGNWKGTSGGEAYSFSGCSDDQTSADTSALSRVTSTGAMTFCFIQAIERGHARTYEDLLTAMRYSIRNVNIGGSGGTVTTLIEMLLTGGSCSGGLTQEPQLTASNPFDFKKLFYL